VNLPVLLKAPAGAGAPSVSGSGQLGGQLSCSQGSWAADLLGAQLYRAPRSFSYQWQRGGADIPGATQSTYTPTDADSYSCRVSASNEAGSSSQTSAARAVAKAAPTNTTNASAGVVIGGQFHDTATIAGGFSPSGQIVYILYGPDDASCSRTPVFSDTKIVSGNADYQSADFTPTAAGTYRWTASYSGDANNNPASSPCNAANESVTVSQSAPLLTTNASPGVILGGSVHDSATLAGGSSPSGQITYTLYGPGDAGCSGTPAFTDTKAVFGNGDYQSADFTPTAPGTYRWTASYSGDANNNAASTACNEGSESVTVTGPSVSKLHLVPDSFVASKQPTPLGPPTPKRVAGTEIRLKLSAKALVHFSIRRVPRHPKPSGPHAAHAFNRRLHAGKQAVRFTGTLDHHTLHPGSYVLYARAIVAATGYRSPKMSAKFSVLVP
jgi:hypothetical protein